MIPSDADRARYLSDIPGVYYAAIAHARATGDAEWLAWAADWHNGPEFADAYYSDAALVAAETAERIATLAEVIPRLVDLRPAMTLLDVGCGNGELAALLQARHGVRAYGVDQSAVGVRQACARGVQASVSPLVGRFDVVVCTDVLEHMPDPAGLIERLKGYTAGALVVSVPRGGDGHIGHVQHFDAASLAALTGGDIHEHPAGLAAVWRA